MLIIKLENYFMIFDSSEIKKQGVIINITNIFLVFWFDYCTFIRATFLLNSLSSPIKTAAIIIEKNITSQKMIKKYLKKDMINFL